jgi:hypothetical protein
MLLIETDSLTADPLCKILWFRWEQRFWNHSQQILSRSWNAVKYYGFDGSYDFGIAHCRSSLGAGML